MSTTDPNESKDRREFLKTSAIAAAGVAGVAATAAAVEGQEPRQERFGLRDGSSEFILVLNGVELADEVRKRIAGALQSALVKELGSIDLGGTIIRFPDRRWYGLWLDRFRDGRLPSLRVREIDAPDIR